MTPTWIGFWGDECSNNFEPQENGEIKKVFRIRLECLDPLSFFLGFKIVPHQLGAAQGCKKKRDLHGTSIDITKAFAVQRHVQTIVKRLPTKSWR